MKSLKHILFYSLIVALLFFILYKWPKTLAPTTTTTTMQLVGGDKDEHGCLGSAGYTWCEQKEKCLRPWEEPCEAVTP